MTSSEALARSRRRSAVSAVRISEGGRIYTNTYSVMDSVESAFGMIGNEKVYVLGLVNILQAQSRSERLLG